MTSEQWKKLKVLFKEAIALPPEKRAAYLDAACGDDAELRSVIDEMLVSHQESEGFLENPGEDFSRVLGNLVDAEDAFIGRRIGSYRIKHVIGEGGMGVVYLAVRDDHEFQRQVAIKIIKRGMDTAALLKRFRNERQTLAVLNHPNICRLLDGGSTGDGQPYFIMEYIDGLPIDKYCDLHKLTISQRLKLFRKVCAAVQYAHQNLIVHRDLKPANILVAPDGEPKLLDFGLAKILDADASGQTLELTAAGVRFLTPEFASPEQMEGNPITTASDVYSLGAILYILLSGYRPYYFKNRSRIEIERVICRELPAAPSSRLKSGMTHDEQRLPAPETVSENRLVSVDKLKKILSGDLDNIVLMALRKEPHRRYQSVEQLLDDIRRHRAGRPVIAGKDTFRYRSGKFIRRRRGVLASLTLVMLVLIVSVANIMWQSRQVNREAAKARQTIAYLKEMLAASDPYDAEKEMTIVELLDKASENIETALKNQPEIEAEVRSILANSYMNSGKFEQALTQFRQALEINRKLFGDKSLPVAANLHDLGLVKHYQGKFDQADSLYLRAIKLYELLASEPSRRYAEAVNDRGLLLLDFSRVDEAEGWLQRSLAMFRQLSDQDNIATGLQNLGYSYDLKGDYENAEKFYRESLALNKKLYGEENIAIARNLNNLASVLMSKGDTLEAVQLLDRSFELRKKILGNEHPDVTLAMHNLAHFLNIQGDYQQAEKVEREALSRWQNSLPADHPYIALSNLLLGRILISLGKLGDAEPFLRKALEIRRKKFGPGNLSVADAQVVLGRWLVLMKRYPKAEKLLLTAKMNLENEKEIDTKSYLIRTLTGLTELYHTWGRASLAREYRKQLQALQRQESM